MVEGSRWSRWSASLTSPWRLFALVVVVPTLIAAVYYLLIAAPIYVSEARFVVRSRAQSAGPAGLGVVLESVGVNVSSGDTDAFEVDDYMTSRDAVADLDRRHGLRAMLDRPEADFLERFPRPFQSHSFESLFKAYQRFVTVGYNTTSGVSTLSVEAFRPRDAAEIANALLNGGEAVINRLNARAARDAVAEAQQEVMESQARSVEAESALTNFRNREQLIDPTRSSLAGLDLVGQLETQLATLRADRASQAALAPQSAELTVIDKRIAAYQTQIETERARVAGQTNSLAPEIGEYEQLVLDRDFADKSLASAFVSLDDARVDARRQQLYLEQVVYPNTPDKAELPHRLLSVAMVLVTTLVAFATVALILAGFREHRQG